ncbi:Os01g0113325 [Oryza sativa Japonica Group]|uniref:Os01g0113325 protein n=1 Tax=Oryza sativa subsp. japonica TaxID=39947 RepID=A0A0P0UXM8_ORYSJ|nr:Os01g0113325 [Oryza sativa Japonica Group]
MKNCSNHPSQRCDHPHQRKVSEVPAGYQDHQIRASPQPRSSKAVQLVSSECTRTQQCTTSFLPSGYQYPLKSRSLLVELGNHTPKLGNKDGLSWMYAAPCSSYHQQCPAITSQSCKHQPCMKWCQSFEISSQERCTLSFPVQHSPAPSCRPLGIAWPAQSRRLLE